MSEQQQPQSGEQVTPSSEQQPLQQPAPVSPEQPAAGNGEQVGGFEPAQPGDQPIPPAAPATDADETTDKGDGAGDQPTPAEVEQAGDVELPEPPENEHAGGDDVPGSAGLGVTGKFVHDEPDAGAEDAGNQ